MPDQPPGVFLSYARINRDAAAQVVDSLRTAGIQVWWDEDLPRGGRWQEVLQEKLQACRAFLVLIGDQGVSGWVGAEVGVALNRHFARGTNTPFAVVPVLLGDAPESLLPPFLSLFQCTRLPQPTDNESSAKLAADLRTDVFAGYQASRNPWSRDRCPFPGLAPYAKEEQALFFGRHREILAALEQFSGRNPDGSPRRWLRLEGNSGVGKSSLVNAGILPAVERGWLELEDSSFTVTLLPTMRPGGHPIASLARAIATGFVHRPELIEQRLMEQSVRLDHLFGEFCKNNTRPLLVIDQFEELFTIADAVETQRLDQLLAEAISGEHGLPLLLITTMRSDFLGKLDQLTSLNALRNGSARFEVPPIGGNGLLEIMTQTTALAGLTFSDPELPKEIIGEALDEPGALPLVSNLLRLLWEQMGDTPILQRAVYNDLGGLGGALAQSADKLLQNLGEQRKESALKLLLALVKPGNDTGQARRQITRDRALMAAGDGKDAEVILNALSGLAVDGSSLQGSPMRLVTLSNESRDDGETVLVDLIHETLLRKNRQGEAYWPTLWNYIREHDEHVAIRTRLDERAAEYAVNNDGSMLARGRELKQFRQHDYDAGEQAHFFIKRSRQRIWKTMGLVFSVISLVTLGFGSAYWVDSHQDPKAHAGFLATLVKSWFGRIPKPRLAEIPPGCFTMGRDEDPGSYEYPARKICFGQAFYMGVHEVTFAQYDAFAIATRRARPDDMGWNEREISPAMNVSWFDARDYAAWLSARSGVECRLPSEAEWEYAARADTTTAYALPAPGGSDYINGKGLANCVGCGSQWDNKQTAPVGKQTAPVGSFEPNGWGLHDMHGNVFEWVQDHWHNNYQGAPENGAAWIDPDARINSSRVLRGGSWIRPSGLCALRRPLRGQSRRPRRLPRFSGDLFWPMVNAGH